MAARFNADEVLGMARRIERNGAAFYRKAAEIHKADVKRREFLIRLAETEDQHERDFAAMQNALKPAEREETVFDPEGETDLYLRAMADMHGGEGSPSAAAKLTGRESLADILRTAIALEHQSILFYLGLVEAVPARLGRDKVQRILAEERSHVAVLARELRAVKG
jgi:rubrerythrin